MNEVLCEGLEGTTAHTHLGTGKHIHQELRASCTNLWWALKFGGVYLKEVG